MEITAALAARLVREQFPQWAAMEVWPVAHSGHDNRTFHLGAGLTVRLPSGPEYVPQIEKEARWLPYLAGRLSLPVPYPVALGRPNDTYPFPWSVNRYLPGETVRPDTVPDPERLAGELAAFLRELQAVDTAGAPAAGTHNFFRGANPAVYHAQTEEALRTLADELPVRVLRPLWERAVASEWQAPPVWIHGDIAPGNLLVREGRLCGVIDFGIMGIGDPACDYAMAWTCFEGCSRARFLQGLDAATVDRARGWALWKALITYHAPDPAVAENARRTLTRILAETHSDKNGGR